MTLHEFLERLQTVTGKGAKKTSSGYSACCPAHEDRFPSLSLGEGENGKILVKCFTGCSSEEICSSLGLSAADLFGKKETYEKPKRTIYFYKDETGQEVYRKIRIEPGFNEQDKSFYCECDDEDGNAIRNIKGCRKLLYRFPEVLKGISDNAQIFLVEGEKDADKLSIYGLVATTTLNALSWSGEFTEVLREADVVVLYDLDKTGIDRRDLLCKSLYRKVKRLRSIDLPDLEYQDSHGSDISDWLEMGHTISELLEIVSKTRDYLPPYEKGKIRAMNLCDFLALKFPEREMLLSPFLPSQGLAMIYAKRGVGKTHIALGIAGAVARGGKFLKWHASRDRKVLFIDGEMPGISIQDRLRRIAATDEFDAGSLTNLQLITPDIQVGPMPDLSTKSGREAIEEFVDDSDLVIIDNISSLFRSGIENDADSWQPAQDWALELRKRGKSILFIHHAGKGGQQRGSSKKEDILDSVICLRNPLNYRPDQGAKFEVIFEKARHFAGNEAASFLVELQETEDGLWNWRVEEALIDPEVAKVAELSNAGLTIQAIADETGFTKNQVTGRQTKARHLGLIE
jgi:5S rRNA maturation endonuclease (ribonuclease M5)